MFFLGTAAYFFALFVLLGYIDHAINPVRNCLKLNCRVQSHDYLVNLLQMTSATSKDINK